VCEKDVVDLMEMLATNPMLYFNWSICPDQELANELSGFANFLHLYSVSTRLRDGGDEPSGPDYVRPLGRIVTALRMCKEHGIFVHAGQYLRVGVCSVELKLWEVPLSTTSLELPCERSSMHIMFSTERTQFRRVEVYDKSVEDSFIVAFALNNKNSFWNSLVQRIAEDPKLRPSFGSGCRPLHLEEFARFCEMAIEADAKDDLGALGRLVPRAFETD
jgi:hypothetical protein